MQSRTSKRSAANQQSVPSELTTTIHEQLLIIQRRVRQEVNRQPTVLSGHESIVLMLLSSMQNATVGDFIDKLKVHQSTISRLFGYLESKGLIRFEQNGSDGRVRFLRFTQAGEKLLVRLCSDSTTISQRCYGMLSSSELSDLVALWTALADGFCISADQGIPQEHPIEPPSRRLVMAMGLAGSEYMNDSGYDISEYQVLFEMFSRQQPTRLKTMTKFIELEQSKLSRFLKRLIDEGLLLSETDKRDSRAIQVLFTTKGKKHFLSKHTGISRRYQKALERFSPAMISRLIKIQSKIIAGPLRLVSDKISVVSDEIGLFEARRFLVENLVATKSHYQLPAILIDETDYVSTAKGDGGQIECLFTLRRSKLPTLEWAVTTEGFDPLAASSALHLIMNATNLQEFNLSEQACNILDWLPAEWRYDIGHKALRRL